MKNQNTFQFRTREEYKKVKAYNRAQLEQYIDLKIKQGTQDTNVLYEQLEQAYTRGWMECVKTSEQVLRNYVEERIAIDDEALLYAIARTNGVGEQRGRTLMSKIYEFRDLNMQKQKASMDSTINSLITGRPKDE